MLLSQHIYIKGVKFMKSNKGITLTSVIIYVIGMTIIVALLSTLTSFFYKNINMENLTNDTATQFTKFSSIFTEEINKENNSIIDCKTTLKDTEDEDKNVENSYIIFSSGNQYTYINENKSIYKNKIKICENVEKCKFSYTLVDGKYSIQVDFKAGNIDLTEDEAITYTM